MVPKELLEQLKGKSLKEQGKVIEEKLDAVQAPTPKLDVESIKVKTVAGVSSLGRNTVDLAGEVVKLGVKGAFLSFCAVANVVNDVWDAKPEKKAE